MSNMNKRIYLEVSNELNRFIKKCIDNNINLYNISYKKDKIIVLIDVKDYLKIKRLNYYSNIRVVKYDGLLNIKKIIKDNMFEVPPLFEYIHQESGTSWEEMYRVFNMGHRLEYYVPEEVAQRIIEIAASFGIRAKVIGRVERLSCAAAQGANLQGADIGNKSELVIKSSKGEFHYYKGTY